MNNIEEYLYYHESQDYAYLKFSSCTYYRKRKLLVIREIYDATIESQLPILKKRLEELYIKMVNLPIKYDFVYKKVFVDNLSLQLEILSFLRQKFKALAGDTKGDDVVVTLDNNVWKVNLFLPQPLIEFLTNSKQWQKFKQNLQAKNFYGFEFFMNPRD